MARLFDTTNWSVIVDAASANSDVSRRAREALCEAYWPPVYAFMRRQGCSVADAEDLTQAYFARFLEKDYLDDVRPEAGRFRSFLLASASHFVCNERDRARSLKRGGGQKPISFDGDTAEARYRLEPSDDVTPQTVFERNWARTVLDRVLVRLEHEVQAEDGGARFQKLKPYLTGDAPTETYAEIARLEGVTTAAIRVAVHRLRRRFRDLLRWEIAQTVADSGEVDAEIRYLLAALGK